MTSGSTPGQNDWEVYVVTRNGSKITRSTTVADARSLRTTSLSLRPLGQLAAELSVQRSFSESALPKTMELAKRNGDRILGWLGDTARLFPFEDRVLIWLAAHWKDDVEKYHHSAGKGMAEVFDSYQRELIDKHYHRVLKNRLENQNSPQEAKQITARMCVGCGRELAISPVSQFGATCRLKVRVMMKSDLSKRIAQLEKENAALRAKIGATSTITCKVSRKGAVSVYGLGRFPVTLYKDQWERLLAYKEYIAEFLEKHPGELRSKA